MYNLIGHIESEVLEVMQTKESKDLDLHIKLIYKNGGVQVVFRDDIKKQQHYHHDTRDRRI